MATNKLSTTKRLRQIAVSGGKGGTGKSTVAVILAKKFFNSGKKVMLCDCDIETPNDYLLVGRPKKMKIKDLFENFPKLDKRKCRKCGVCQRACPNHAIFQPPGRYPVFVKELCLGCGLCEKVCPFGAITMQKEKAGSVWLSEPLKKLTIVWGEIKPTIQESGKFVKETKETALLLAKQKNVDIVIFDTAAGTHCPVINALLGSQLCYLVTEPTPMGQHDLETMIKLCKKLKIPSKIVLNKWGAGNEKLITSVLKKYHLSINYKVPYSQEILKSYLKGSLANDINLSII